MENEGNEEGKCPACEKKTARTEEQKKKLLNRLNRIEGQVRGIKKMIENDAYCGDVLTQAAAVSAAMDAFNREVLRAHVRACVVRDIRAGRDDAPDELMDILEKLMR
ncbi:MAG: metal-sensing transcriptional repressor [Clostridia bacterium]|nr:metal-sensing transcriptional repressor [Clostridia bacterium]